MAERIPNAVALRVALYAYLSGTSTPATGKTIAVTISKNGSAYGNPNAGATSATEIGNGSYYVDLDTTDTGTDGPLLVLGTASGIDDVKPQPYEVVTNWTYGTITVTTGGFQVTNVTGSAMTLNASASGHALDMLSATGNGLNIGGGVAGFGILINSGAACMYLEAQGGNNCLTMYAPGGNAMDLYAAQNAIYAQSTGADAILAYAGTNGIGFHVYGGQASGSAAQFDTNGTGNGLVINNGIGGILDGSITYQQGAQAMLAVLNGASSGFNGSGGVTGAAFKDPTGATARVTVTTNGSGDRTSITNDFT